MFKRKNVIAFLLISLLLSATSIAETNTRSETKTSPNYLVILVTGVNTTGWIFRGGKGMGDSATTAQNGSEISKIPDNMRGYGDLLGYLNNDLGLDGYVYYYTFSQRDGHIEQLARELGDPNYNNPASYAGSIMNHKGLKDQPDITSSSRPELMKYLRSSNSDNTTPPIVDIGSDGKGNCWLEQARQDFRAWFKKSGPGSKFDPPRDPTEAEIPKKYILICHSMGGLIGRAYMTSNYYRDDVASIITIDSQHLGSDACVYKKLLYSPENIIGTSLTAGVGMGYIIASLMGRVGPPSISNCFDWSYGLSVFQERIVI